MGDAVIIPFPKQNSPAADQQRLRRALEDLQAALSEQKKALDDWRFAMTELGVGVSGLGLALGSYQESLGDVEKKLGGLRVEAQTLESWADGLLQEGMAHPTVAPGAP